MLPNLGFEKLNVRIPGKKLLDDPVKPQEVSFEGLELYIYTMNGGQVQVGARAQGVALVGDKS